MSAKDDAAGWAETVQQIAAKRDLRYDAVGGLNPVGGPVALCPGGTNRVTGQLEHESWGAACDADEREEGGLFSKAVLPGAVMVKAHMPDLAQVMPAFDVESIEKRPDELVIQKVARKVEFESINFNQRFLATVPKQYDPIALRELFSPGFLEWASDHRPRGRLRRQREADLLPLEPSRAHRGRVRRGARGRRRALPPGPQGDGRVRDPHLPGGPLARRPRALPGGHGLGGGAVRIWRAATFGVPAALGFLAFAAVAQAAWQYRGHVEDGYGTAFQLVVRHGGGEPAELLYLGTGRLHLGCEGGGVRRVRLQSGESSSLVNGGRFGFGESTASFGPGGPSRRTHSSVAGRITRYSASGRVRLQLKVGARRCDSGPLRWHATFVPRSSPGRRVRR